MRRQLLQLFFLLISTSIFAQDYSYRHYSISDGLKQTQVTSIFQDSKGYIWVGTKGGVSRFDGIEFENFGIEDGLTSRIVCNISEGTDGNIYILCDHGLSVFDGTQLTPYPFPGTIRAYLGVASVAHDLKGNTWIASRSLHDWVFLKFVEGCYTSAYRELDFPDTVKVTSLLFDELNDILMIGTYGSGIYSSKDGFSLNILDNILNIRLIKKDGYELIFSGRYENVSDKKVFKVSTINHKQFIEIYDSVWGPVLYMGENNILFLSFDSKNICEYNAGVFIKYKKSFSRDLGERTFHIIGEHFTGELLKIIIMMSYLQILVG